MASFELHGLLAGKILTRYKRFLADVELDDGSIITAHCTNTGAMTTCWMPRDLVLLQPSQNPARKLPFTLIACKRLDTWVGVETGMPNRIVAQWLKDNAIAELKNLHGIKSEVPYGHERSRIDIFALDSNNRHVYIEIKNTTLRQDDTVLFPDAKTVRGAKHLRELRAMADAGHRAVILFFIDRSDVCRFAPARHIDPNYADELERAVSAGVEVLPLFTSLNAIPEADGTWCLSYT